MNLADELCKLTELHQAGDLTDQEFADAKRRLIADVGAKPPPPQTIPGRLLPPLPQPLPQEKKKGPLRTIL